MDANHALQIITNFSKLDALSMLEKWRHGSDMVRNVFCEVRAGNWCRSKKEKGLEMLFEH